MRCRQKRDDDVEVVGRWASLRDSDVWLQGGHCSGWRGGRACVGTHRGDEFRGRVARFSVSAVFGVIRV